MIALNWPSIQFGWFKFTIYTCFMSEQCSPKHLRRNIAQPWKQNEPSDCQCSSKMNNQWNGNCLDFQSGERICSVFLNAWDEHKIRKVVDQQVAAIRFKAASKVEKLKRLRWRKKQRSWGKNGRINEIQWRKWKTGWWNESTQGMKRDDKMNKQWM